VLGYERIRRGRAVASHLSIDQASLEGVTVVALVAIALRVIKAIFLEELLRLSGAPFLKIDFMLKG
jgi:hypothetical protein